MHAINYLIICAALITGGVWLYNCWRKHGNDIEMAIEPCKICGANGQLDGVGCDSFVRCSSPACAMQGPYGKNCLDAVTAWNNMPSMTAIVYWQFQTAFLALELQRQKAMVDWLASMEDGHPCTFLPCPFGSTYDDCGCARNSVDCWKQSARNALEVKA